MKQSIFFLLVVILMACDSSDATKTKESENKEDPQSELMINDTLCDCTALDINRDLNIIHLAGVEEGYTGWCVLYRRGGKIQSKRQYKDGMLNGSFLTYHPNGMLESSIPHKNNKYDGLYIKLNEQGDTIYKKLYNYGAAVNDSIQ